MSRGSSRNLVITGFMGTGKTATGQVVAARLGRPLIDTDRLIEKQAGCSIAEIFEQHGEAHFRQMEAEVCRELAARQGLVIATGGWTLGPETNRAALSDNCLLICLTAAAPELIRRLECPQERPLLATDDWRLRLELLLARRQPTYRQIALQVDTTGLTPEETAGRVMALWQAFSSGEAPLAVPISAGTTVPSTQVLVGRGMLEHVGVLIEAAMPRLTGVVVVSDEHVGPLYGPPIAGQLPILNRIDVPAGEEYKALNTVQLLYDALLAAGLDRQGLVIALGGGVVGDLAGFAAATYLRGVRLVQVPTTLLAMVDASIGAKTGVDLPQGKNLVGAFKPAALVAVDPDVLRTLPDVELRTGLAEVVKHGLIGDAGLFEALESGRLEDWKHGTAEEGKAAGLEGLLARAIAVKRDVVEADPLEEGRRAVLNLGHTFGHALEVCSGYRLRHGQAVAIGLVAAAETAARLAVCEPSLPGRVAALLRRLGLPASYRGSPPAEILAAMGTDKKRVGRRLRFVLPEAVGRVVITDQVPEPLILEVLARLQEEA